MRPHSRRLRDDRLSVTLRSGMRAWRGAEPSDDLWRRIAAEIEPRTGGRGRGVSFFRTTLLSLVLLVGVAISGLGAELRSTGLAPQIVDSQLASAPGGLSLIEHEVAKASLGPWAAIMPPAHRHLRHFATYTPVPREAYNRSLWLADARPPLNSPVAPLTSVEGQ